MKKLDESGLDKVSGGAADHPGQQKIGYTVKRGDTLIKIANQFGVSVLDLVTWNDIRNPDLIYPGQLLVIADRTMRPAILILYNAIRRACRSSPCRP